VGSEAAVLLRKRAFSRGVKGALNGMTIDREVCFKMVFLGPERRGLGKKH
jgi:hypothetical protein